ncbi:amino acid permease [Lactobacillus delbrueckii subsp. bulgaricus]
MPYTGSFHVYAKNLLNPATGFTVAILYWLTWTIALGSEFTAAGIIMRHWFPSVPVWIWSLVCMILIFLSNFFSVKIFAESEFWFAAVKVAAIVAFIILVGLAVVGVIPLKGSQGAPGLTNLTKDGWFPTGCGGVFYHYAHGQLCLLGDGADRDHGRGSQGTGKDPA